MLLTSLIPAYIDYARHEKGYAETTIKQWANGLRCFCRFAGEDATTADLHVLTLRRYLYALRSRAKPARPRTVRSRFAAVNSFCAWLVQQQVIPSNPVPEVELPKLDAARRDRVSDEQATALLAACHLIADDRRAALSFAVLSLLTMSGLRRAELLALQVGDIELSEGAVDVRIGKGSKRRTVYVCKECCDAVRNYLKFRPADCRHKYLFATDRNRRVANNGLDAILATVKAIAGYKGATNIKPHALRRNYATRADRQGASLTQIQSALGHSSPATTAIYLHADEQDARRMADLGALKPERSEGSTVEEPARRTKKPAASWRSRQVARG